VPKPTPELFFCLVTLTLDLLNPNQLGFQDSWWNISTSSLVILAASVFETWCGKTETNAGENAVPATAVGVGHNQSDMLTCTSTQLHCDSQLIIRDEKKTLMFRFSAWMFQTQLNLYSGRLGKFELGQHYHTC